VLRVSNLPSQEGESALGRTRPPVPASRLSGRRRGGADERGRVPLRDVPAVTAGLDPAYEHCRQVNRRYGTTYYFSTCFFPPRLRPAVHALYAWVRYPDEWVDNPGDLTVAQQAEKLRQWRDATADAIKSGGASHPVLAAWSDSARRHAVPVAYMRAFLDAMEMDLTVREYPTFEDLQRYTYGSASVVGLMMCHLVGATDPAAVPHATSLGLAMQLTNFLRDVGEDWRERQRLYLPLEDLERFGVSREDIAAGRVTPAFCDLMRFEIDRARAFYRHADAGMAYLPPEARLPVRLARLLYARLLDKIEQNQYDVFTRRARVPTWEKLLVLAREQGRV
jgi:Phytoene/squalene synthetase